MCSALTAELLREGETTYQIIADRACGARRRRITVKPLSVWQFALTYAETVRFGAEYKDGSGRPPRGLTYRPRSVSSLLILLSAMLF